MKCKLFGVNVIADFSIFIVFAIALIFDNKQILYAVFFSSLHEVGHILALNIFGGKPDIIRISFYGIGLKYSSKLNWKQELVFLFSGITINAVFALFNVQRNINLALLLINSLPIFPLDMGRCLKIIADNFLNVNFSYKLITALSIVQIFAILAFSVLRKNPNLIMISVYLIMFWIKEVLYD